MKKLLYILAAVATMSFAASCAKEIAETRVDGDLVQGIFTVAMPGAEATKTISDGLSATNLLFYAFDENGAYLPNLKPETDVTFSNKKASLTLQFVRGMKYSFVFIAVSDDGKTAYTFDTSNKVINVDYSKVTTNNDVYDLFVNYLGKPDDLYEVKDAFNENVTLTRPFAQVNVATTPEDWTFATKSGLQLDGIKTKLTFSKLGTSYGVYDGVVANTAENVAVALETQPGATLTSGATDYKYIAMAYVLTPAAGKDVIDNVVLDITNIKNASGADLSDLNRKVVNVPLQKNYRTNILGSIFTVSGTFDIEILEGFEDAYPDDDNMSDYLPTFTSIDAINAAFKANPVEGVGYKVALEPETPAGGTIMLPNSAEDVSISIIGDFSNEAITIVYSDEDGALKPGNLEIYAQSLGTLNANLTSTHIELLSGSNITTEAIIGSSNTTFIMKPNTFVEKLTIVAGSLLVEAAPEASTEPDAYAKKVEVAATATDAKTVIEGKVDELNVEAGNVEVKEGAQVGELNVDNTSGNVGDVVVDQSVNIENVESDVPVMNPENKAFFDAAEVTGTATVTLEEDVVLPRVLDIYGNITLDLNGKAITADPNLKFTGGLIMVHRGAKLTIVDATEQGIINSGEENDNLYAAIQLTHKDDEGDAVATLDVQGGILKGYYYGIVGNGSRHNTSITVGKTKAVKVYGLNGAGIYHPQDGTLAVKGSKTVIEGGDSGIEMRAGTLTFTGATVTANGTPTNVQANGSGTTAVGAGIAVCQHNTLLPVNVTVSGGTIQGHTAVLVANPQNNNAEEITKVTVSLTGGTYKTINGGTNAVAKTEAAAAATLAISGGNYYGADPSVYVVEGKKAYEKTSGDVTYYQIQPYVIENNATSLVSNIPNNGEYYYTLGSDITMNRIGSGIFSSGLLDINLNGYNITFTNAATTAGILLRASGALNIKGSGRVVSNGYGVWASSASNTVNIYGGDFEAATHVLYAENGTINVYGGSFKLTSDPDLDVNGHEKFLLNCKDANYTAGTAKINVYGGKFYNFNPAESYSEPNGPVSFVATGYHVEYSIEEGVDVYTVVAD